MSKIISLQQYHQAKLQVLLLQAISGMHTYILYLLNLCCKQGILACSVTANRCLLTCSKAQADKLASLAQDNMSLKQQLADAKKLAAIMEKGAEDANQEALSAKQQATDAEEETQVSQVNYSQASHLITSVTGGLPFLQ